MDIDNKYEVIFCNDEREYRVYCDICANPCIK